MSQTTSQKFIKGAAILAVSNLVIKLMGAAYKIPLRRLIGVEGMGIYAQAYQIYMWLFIVATAGIPVAISKLVAESNAYGNYKESRKIFNIAFYLLAITGLVGTIFIIIFSNYIAVNLLKDPAVDISLLAIAPSIFFVSIVSAYRGFFQGRQNMVPTASSQFAEEMGKLVIGFFLAYIWISRGVKYSVFGAIIGVTSGTFLAFVIMFIIYRYRIVKKEKENENKVIDKLKSSKRILKDIVRIAIPISLGASVFSLTTTIDALMIKLRLQDIGLSIVESRIEYGYLTDAVTLFNFPPTIVIALSISIVPVIANALIKNENDYSLKMISSTLRMTMAVAIPSAIGLSVLSGPSLLLVFADAGASKLLSILAFAVIFVSIVHVSNAILQAAGKPMVAVKHLLIGGIIKIALNYILIGIPSINIVGATISTNVCYIIIMILNFIALKRHLGYKIHFLNLLFRPLASSLLMGAFSIFTYMGFYRLTSSNGISTLLAIFVGIIIYLISVVYSGGVDEEEILMLPKGIKILSLLKKIGLMR